MKEPIDAASARHFGVFYPLLYVCITVSGPTLGVLLSKECPPTSVKVAFFLPLTTFLVCYIYVLLKKAHLLLNPHERSSIEVMLAEDRILRKGHSKVEVRVEEIVPKPPKGKKT